MNEKIWKKRSAKCKKDLAKAVNDKDRYDLQAEIEQNILENEFSICQLSYHRGKYNSPPLRILVKQADKIFKNVKNYLLAIPDKCKDTEVKETYKAYNSLFLYISRLFYCYV